MNNLIQTCADFIKSFEGCKLTAYQDIGGRWTIGYGAIGPGIEAGVEWSQQECDDRLASDVQNIFNRVQALVKVPCNANQMSALVSFAYNVGPHNLARSGLLKLLNRANYSDAADQFLLWDKVGSYVSPGLRNRREVERMQFLKIVV